MGYEYNFKITIEELENLSRCVDGIDNLDELLRGAPNFIGTDNGVYEYSDLPDVLNRWPSNISIQEGGLYLCIYKQTGDEDLMNYLIRELLNRCGHVEIEDA